MSGICGAWALDGAKVALDPIIASLERRGPDGTHKWSDGHVSLGHTLLATTPESLIEILPLTDPDSGCTITADVRLDNREDLIERLGLEGAKRTIGDGELILCAYLRWGVESPKNLLGDFAFAIWDPRSASLFCARDQVGMRQLCYHHQEGELFAFATEPEALVLQEAVPKRINVGRVADVLDNLEGIDLTSTFFDEIYYLPPAHTLTLDSHGSSTSCYWKLRAQPELKLGNDEAYAQAFLEVFTEAVRCRLRKAGPIGSMLSGGIDSNSVTALANQLLINPGDSLHTFSALGPEPSECLETQTIRIASSIPGPQRHFVNYADLGTYQKELMRLWESAIPFDSHMTLVRAVYLTANRAGVKIVLDGVASDYVLSAGNAVVNFLDQGNFRKAWNEAKGEAQFWSGEPTALKIFVIAIWLAFAPRPVQEVRRAIARWFRNLRGGNTLVSPAFARRTNLKVRRARYRMHGLDPRLTLVQQRARSIVHPHHVAARARYDRVASALGIEPRDPFLDIRVIELSLSLPWSQLQSDGWPKMILRRAMTNLLPPEVIWRVGKEHLGWAFTKSLFDHWPGWQRRLRTAGPQISTIAQLPSHRLTESQNRNASYLHVRTKIFSLLCWRQTVHKVSGMDGKVREN